MDDFLVSPQMGRYVDKIVNNVGLVVDRLNRSIADCAWTIETSFAPALAKLYADLNAPYIEAEARKRLGEDCD